jgi:hypothetical protein
MSDLSAGVNVPFWLKSAADDSAGSLFASVRSVSEMSSNNPCSGRDEQDPVSVNDALPPLIWRNCRILSILDIIIIHSDWRYSHVNRHEQP